MNEIRNHQNITLFSLQKPSDRISRVKAVLKILAVILILLSINNILFFNKSLIIEFTFVLTLIAIFHFLVTSDTTNIISGMLLWTMLILATYTAWEYDGLHDTAIFAFPCILIFAAMLGGKTFIYPIVAYMITIFYFFAYADATGFLESRLHTNSSLWRKANNLSILLLVYGAVINIVTDQMKTLVGQLIYKKNKSEEMKKKADQLILFDHLTNLPNELSCQEQLSSYIENSRINSEIVGFLTLGFNNFKLINSSLGHKVGDKIIIYLAEQLQKIITDRIHLYRSPANEFIVIVQARDYEDIAQCTHQLSQAVSRPFQIDDSDIQVLSSIGISIAPFDGSSFEELRQKSHTALSQTIKDEPNTFKYFEIEMDEEIKRRLKMVQELKHAITHQEFELYYQAKVDLRDESVVGAEALIRWHKNSKVTISPVEFISVAEKYGLISEIGMWVLQQACSDCKEWHDQGFNHLTVAVNLSPIQFKRGNLPGIVFRALSDARLDTSFLELEITESLFMEDTEQIKEQFHQLSKKGVSIAIDDFGTGYSNLNYLTKFNASTLKIDMSFVRNMIRSEQQEHIVTAIIKMSHVMKLDNVAEGVEDVATFKKLKELGSQYGQGYYWSKPIPQSQFIDFLSSKAVDSKTE